VSGLATSFRTESGLPIPGTDRTLPGGRDFDRARGALEGAASGFDSAVSAGVEAATLDPDDAPLELSDVPLRDPGETAAIATLGTEAGRAGARAGIERGIQSFNPAAAGQDAATFTEFGVRGADRVQDAEADEIQTGLDVGEAAGETAVEVGPEVAGAAVVDEPSRAFEAGATGATVAGLGALGPSAAGAGARTGRRVAGDALDSSSARRLLDDDRGQLDFGRSDGDDSTTIEIDEPDDFDPQRVTRAEVTRSRDTSVRRDTGTFSRSFDQSRPTGSRRGGRGGDDPDRVPLEDEPMIESRTFEGLPTGRSAPEPDFAGLGAATRQADADVAAGRGGTRPPSAAGRRSASRSRARHPAAPTRRATHARRGCRTSRTCPTRSPTRRSCYSARSGRTGRSPRGWRPARRLPRTPSAICRSACEHPIF